MVYIHIIYPLFFVVSEGRLIRNKYLLLKYYGIKWYVHCSQSHCCMRWYYSRPTAIFRHMLIFLSIAFPVFLNLILSSKRKKIIAVLKDVYEYNLPLHFPTHPLSLSLCIKIQFWFRLQAPLSFLVFSSSSASSPHLPRILLLFIEFLCLLSSTRVATARFHTIRL